MRDQTAKLFSALPLKCDKETSRNKEATMQALQSEIEALIEQSGAEHAAVAFHDLETGRELMIDADAPFHPASTFKLCVMMELHRQAHEGAFSLDTPLLIKNEFVSIADGSSFSLFEGDDAEPTLYRRIGERENLREINRLMIVQSSNLATNLLIELLTAAKVTAFMQELGAPELKVLRGPEDNRAYALDLNNAATARGLMQVLRLLAEGEVVSPEASKEMIEVLQGQMYNEGVPAGTPSGVKVAHKTGWNDRLYHDAAIVFPPGHAPYVLVVLTRGLPEETKAPLLVSRIARLIYASLHRR